MQQESDQRPFTTTCKTDSANETAIILLVDSDMTIHWGDIYSSADITITTTRTYVNCNIYLVFVYGGLRAIRLSSYPNMSRLVPVDHRGDVSL